MTAFDLLLSPLDELPLLSAPSCATLVAVTYPVVEVKVREVVTASVVVEPSLTSTTLVT